MQIDRAATYGLIATVGVTAISLVTAWLLRSVIADSIGRPDPVLLLIVAIAGTAVTMIFLFAVIGVFVDRKLEARESSTPTK